MNSKVEMKIPKDLSQIDTSNLGEFIWWSAHLGSGCEKLLSAIGKVGNRSDRVRQHLVLNKTKCKNC